MTPEPSPKLDPNLAAALDYAAHGLRVIPIAPGAKHPANIGRWQEAATVDPELIVEWWNGLYRGHGVGIVTGSGSGVWVLDIDVADGKRGDEVLDELVAAHGPLPATHEVITGSGGRHLYFAWPDGQAIRNNQSGKLGAGIDVRGEGGQVLAPPTIHPNGQPYEHETSSPHLSFAPAPAWLLSLLAAEPELTSQPRPPSSGGDRPGDLWAAQTSWDQILTVDGWTLHHTDADGEQHWTRPGKDRRDGTSATVGYRGCDVLKVFTSSHRHLRADQTYSKLGYLAATRHDGDHRAAARALSDAGWRQAPPNLADLTDPPSSGHHETRDEQGEPVEGDDDWAAVDLTDILSGDHEAPRPTILHVDGALLPLFYTCRVNVVFGESGGGKSWVTLAAAVEVVQSGRDVLLIDLEDSAYGVVPRLLALGLTAAEIAAHVHYVAPSTAWDARAQVTVGGLLDAHDVALAVIDSTGEAMAAAGIKGNDDDDVARWMRVFPRWIATHARGPAVLAVDHTPKADDAPKLYAIGSQRKRAAVDGASYRLDTITAPDRQTDGLMRLTTAKDRNGHRAQGTVAAMVSVTHSGDGGVVIAFTKPDAAPIAADGDMRPTVLMERVSRWIETHPGATGAEVRASVKGKTAYVVRALDLLVAEGWAKVEPGPRNASHHHTVRQYREDAETVTDLVDDPEPVTCSPPVPDLFPSAGNRSNRPVPGRPHPEGAGNRSSRSKGTGNPATCSPPNQEQVDLDPALIGSIFDPEPTDDQEHP